MSDNCQEALDKLYAYLDRELDSDSVAAIRDHGAFYPQKVTIDAG